MFTYKSTAILGSCALILAVIMIMSQFQSQSSVSTLASRVFPINTASTGHVDHAFLDFVSLANVEKSYLSKPPIPAAIRNCMMGSLEPKLLYALGEAAAGPILEIGPFCGCSTIQLALGRRARMKNGKNATFAERPFYTSDIFPGALGSKGPYRFDYTDDSKQKVSFFYDNKAVDNGTDAKNMGYYGVPSAPGGMLDCLRKNLWDAGVSPDDVGIIATGVRHAPILPYRLIWSDFAHDLHKLLFTLPYWQHRLGQGYPVLIAFHDTANDPVRTKYLADYFRAVHTVSVDLVFALEVPADWTPPFDFSAF